DSIRQRGITTVAEALRGVPGVHVGRINTGQWAVSIRGFSGRYTNKLLVLVDGRSVYVPSFSGVYWDELDTLLDDIDRIEVIRGPGGTLWGPNAVNGIVNIITRNAAETPDTLLVAGSGNQQPMVGNIRSGFALGSNTAGRVFAKVSEHDGFRNQLDQQDSNEQWDQTRLGFRLDSEPNQRDSLTLQGDTYRLDGQQQEGILGLDVSLGDYRASGSNLLGRWSRTLSDNQSYSLQAYFDHVSRRESFLQQRHDTIDLDFQHRVPLSETQDLLWGINYRRVSDRLYNGTQLLLTPERNTASHYGLFVQNEITLGASTRVILGSKFDQNAFTGFEYQPNLRVVWQPNDRHTVWASIARAVRTPSRIEQDARITLPQPVNALFGNPDIESENLASIEFGYRFSADNGFSLDVTAYKNEYRDIIGSELRFPPTQPPLLDIVFNNNLTSESHGVEAALSWQPSPRWRLNGNYTLVKLGVDLQNPNDAGLVFEGLQLRTPEHQFTLDSDWTISDNWFFHLRTQYVDGVPPSQSLTAASSEKTESYVGVDASLSWRHSDRLELLLSAKNLLGTRLEFLGETLTPGSEIDRMGYLQLRFSWD
ncbi:MAG: TonB-dependent receptor plug domain-containing protein, partial [Lysobacterales bacterium]